MAGAERRSCERRAGNRRQADRRTGTERRQSRSRELITKYRQPLIGLGLAGAAVPLVNAGRAAEQAGEEDAASSAAAPDVAAALAAARAAGEDTEEQLASRIAESRATDRRAGHIQGAVQQFGISEELAADIYDIAEQENIDPDVAYGLVRTESTFNERAVSHVGARGLTQVMPRTARGIIPGMSTDQLFDRKTNLRLGFRYLDQLLQKYRGNMDLALTAYNRGPGTVDKVLKRGGNPDNGYAGKVLRGS
ncbi:MAG TPA: lytic transglycosylase domain-containing protein [Longimicrobiales bacterium]|nr:lytic transglycosylase domain-containing protein [Longimicrobiales bacterium]